MESTLIDPPGRQGPGMVGGPVVNAIELALARRSGGVLPGEYQAPGLGGGTELSQLRPYVEGDDVRFLDAAASARTGEAHVRLHVPERALTTWIVLDIGASMAFGTADRLKSDVAEGAVRVISRLSVRRGGRVSLLRWNAHPSATTFLPPAGGRPALGGIDRALAEGVSPDGAPDTEDLASALRRLHRVARRPGLVAVVSDFRDPSAWEGPLSVLAHRHGVLAIDVADPREHELPDAGLLMMIDPASGQTVEVDTSSPQVRSAFAAAETARRERVDTALRRVQARHVRLSTDSEWLRDLGRGLR